MDVVHLLSFRDCSGASSLQCLAFFLTLLENGIATGESREEVIFFSKHMGELLDAGTDHAPWGCS